MLLLLLQLMMVAVMMGAVVVVVVVSGLDQRKLLTSKKLEGSDDQFAPPTPNLSIGGIGQPPGRAPEDLEGVGWRSSRYLFFFSPPPLSWT